MTGEQIQIQIQTARFSGFQLQFHVLSEHFHLHFNRREFKIETMEPIEIKDIKLDASSGCPTSTPTAIGVPMQRNVNGWGIASN